MLTGALGVAVGPVGKGGIAALLLIPPTNGFGDGMDRKLRWEGGKVGHKLGRRGDGRTSDHGDWGLEGEDEG